MSIRGLATLLLALVTNATLAALGSTPANFGSHALTAQRQAGSTGSAAYTDLQTGLDSGTSVHEYLDGQGTVFAVSWSGPFPPDLKELLGSHFSALVAQAGTGQPMGRQLSVRQSDLVIVSGGHMGAFEGQAWLPAKLPPGFDPGEIK